MQPAITDVLVHISPDVIWPTATLRNSAQIKAPLPSLFKLPADIEAQISRNKPRLFEFNRPPARLKLSVKLPARHRQSSLPYQRGLRNAT